jgi:drug/metabolite transporter (DMT)-like permease
VAVFFAYISVVLIWATTPLAIQWSSDSLSFIAAAASRMLLALALALAVHALLRQSLLDYWYQRKIYFAASLGIFPNMPLVYWAAQFIPSGLVAIIFALSPFATGVMTLLLLKQNPFGIKRVLALLLAISGLVVIFYHQMRFDSDSIYGVVGILLSCALFSFSSVWVKKISEQSRQQTAPFQQATGALLFALPGLLLSWWWMDGSIPAQVSLKSAGAVVYLAIVGSLLGAVMFFFILQRLSASAVSLVTLMTPVLAIVIGKHLADEVLPVQTLIGVSIVLAALLLYSPWSLREWHGALTTKLLRALREPAIIEQSEVQILLKQAQEDVDRYK